MKMNLKLILVVSGLLAGTTCSANNLKGVRSVIAGMKTECFGFTRCLISDGLWFSTDQWTSPILLNRNHSLFFLTYAPLLLFPFSGKLAPPARCR
jgi:hypothetical protein